MTLREFQDTLVSRSTKVIISEREYEIFSLDYQSGLIQIRDEEGILEVPYKFCKFTQRSKPMNNIKLTEKVKGDFEKWFYQKYLISAEWLYKKPLSMQKGVYERYFRERWGIEIQYNGFVENEYFFRVVNYQNENLPELSINENHDTAFTEAVNQASQIAEKEEK